MNVRRMLSWSLLTLLSCAALSAFAQAPAPKPAVATIGPRRVTREEYEQRLAVARAQMASRLGSQPAEMQDVLRRQMLETLIRLNLLVLEAKRTGVTPSAAQAESALKRDSFFSPNGQFDAMRWQQARLAQGGRFQAAIGAMSEQLGARELDQRVRARVRPSAEELHAKAVRQLRRVITDDLSLRASDFDGGYPEPRERDVLAWYDSHPDAFRRPDRAVLSVVFVNEPPRTTLEASDAAAGQAWLARMRRAADSVITAVRAGATLEDASAAYGGPRAGVAVLADNFPGYWKGSAAQSAAVFRTRAGALLGEPVPATDGWLVARVDEVQPAHVAPLAAVAKEIRGRLREDSRLHHDEREQRALFTTLRDSLSGPAWTFRWAAVDTGTLRIGEPSEADLDRWYRGHLADFSSFDSKSGTIVARSLGQVHDEVRARWRRDQRLLLARTQAAALYEAWSAGRRAGSLESELKVRETKPAPMGADVDTGFAAVALSDTVWKRGEPRGAGIAPYARGFLVWQVTNRIAEHTPSFEQVQGALKVALEARQRAVAEAGAMRLFERDPVRFGSGKRYFFTRMLVATPPIQDVRLTRAEVERWHRSNLERYSAQELVRAKHILITPLANTAAADRAARVRADSLLARIRAGESFDLLAARFSDDPATKDKGGDIGVFQRGAMLAPFEDAAFAMKEGELAGPVRTEAGYHIILCTEHVPAYVQPLKLVYSIVASDLAHARADTIAMQRADSLLRLIRTPADARAFAKRYGFATMDYVQPVDEPQRNAQLEDYFRRLFAMKPGQLMPAKQLAKGAGYWITWVDSIGAPVKPVWESAREPALAAYRAGAGERALLAKTAELDSLLARGWSFDSLGTLWGGLTRSREMTALGGSGRETLPAALDSLVFGTDQRPAALGVGDLSGWVRWSGGLARVRLVERREPTPDRLKVRMDELANVVVERRLAEYFDDLRRRYPVRILDRALAAIPLPALPPEE